MESAPIATESTAPSAELVSVISFPKRETEVFFPYVDGDGISHREG